MGSYLLKEAREKIVSKPRVHIERIRKDFQASQRVKDSLNNSIQALAHDLYDKETHFIFELIQNAEDNSYNKTEPFLSFLLVKNDPTNTQNAVGALIIQNNEIGFSPDNVDAICAVGKTTKSKIQGYIGEKGIGFKSVFQITTIPHIFSGGYRFCLPEEDKETGLGYIVPRWIEKPPKKIDLRLTTMILPLDKQDFGYEKIEEMLRDIEPETILFLSKLKKIKIMTDTGDKLTILKDDSKVPLIQILIEGERQGNSLPVINKLLLYTKTVDKPENVNHGKRIDIDKRDVSIAFPVDDNKESAGKIFAYLPVRSDTGLPFLINADFILTSSREEILGNVCWNEWLMKCVATLVADALPQLKEKGLLSVDLLGALAKRMNELDENSMFYPIVEAVRDALLDQELLPADDGTFVAARNAKLARGAELRKLLTHNQLRELFQSNDDIKWLSGEITQDRIPDLRSYLMSELDVEEITPDGFARRISSTFLASQTDDWFIAFYKYLSGQEALWRSPRWARDSGGLLRLKPILRLQDNKQEVPFRSDGMANAYLPPPEETDFPVVKREIVDNEQASGFLRRLGLSEPDVFDDIVERVLPKYSRQDVSSITPREHAMDIQKILRAMVSDSEAGKRKVLRAAKNAPFLRAVDRRGKVAFQKPGDIYVKDEDLQLYFSKATDVWFLDETSVDLPPDAEAWANLGIALRPKRIPFSGGVPSNEREYSTRQESIENYDLYGLDEFLEHLDDTLDINGRRKLSLVLWNYLREHLESNPRFFKGRYEWFYYSPYTKYFDSRMLVRLRESAWIVTQDGNLEKPSDITVSQLGEEFVGAGELIEILDIQQDSDQDISGEEKNQLIRTIGFESTDEAQKMAELARLLKAHGESPDAWIEKLKPRNKPAFPTRISTNPDRQQERLAEQISDAPEKEYEQRNRSVRTTKGTIDPALWLRNQYTNEDSQMICQICKEEMPFRKRDGEYYFEAVEALSRDHFAKEHEAQYLALCPLCAAMYNEFVKHDEEAMEHLKDDLIAANDLELHINLGDREASLRFVETHINDLKVILLKFGDNID